MNEKQVWSLSAPRMKPNVQTSADQRVTLQMSPHLPPGLLPELTAHTQSTPVFCLGPKESAGGLLSTAGSRACE